MLRASAALATFALAVAPALAHAGWNEPVGGASPVNESASRNAGAPWLTTVAGVPYLAWSEETTAQGSASQVRVARLSVDGTAWQKVADGGTNPISRSATTLSADPSLADVGGVPWVAWSEDLTTTDREIRVARLSTDGGSWQRMVDTTRPINLAAGTAGLPTIASDGGTRPYVSFFEADPGSGSQQFPGDAPAQVLVKRLSADGSAWQLVGGGPVSDPSQDATAPRMALVAGVPWVAYLQAVTAGGNPAVQVLVAHPSADGQSWVHVGPVATGSPGDLADPSIASVAGRPVLAFGDTAGGTVHHIRAFGLDAAGTGWDVLGGGPVEDTSADAGAASVADVQGQPWVAYGLGAPGARQIRVAALIGGVWRAVAGQVAHDPSQDASAGPALASVNGFPWVALGESDGSTQGPPACCAQARVSRLEPDFGAPSAAPLDTAATLVAPFANLYGLPFAVGIQYGAGVQPSAATPMAAPASDPGALFRTVAGLAPSSLYSYRAVTTAGTSLPLVTGPTGYFATQAPFAAPPALVPPKLFVAFIDTPGSMRTGRRLAWRYIVSDDAQITVTIRRGKSTIKTIRQNAGAGRHVVRWLARSRYYPARTGRYVVTIKAVSGTRHAQDAFTMRLLPLPARHH